MFSTRYAADAFKAHGDASSSGIGGELGVPCTTNRLYGGPNAPERRRRGLGIQHENDEVSPLCDPGRHGLRPEGRSECTRRGIRSGRERSSPTRSFGCRGKAELRTRLGRF